MVSLKHARALESKQSIGSLKKPKSMTINVVCNCGKKLRTSDDKAGMTANCPQCGEPVTAPDPRRLLPVSQRNRRATINRDRMLQLGCVVVGLIAVISLMWLTRRGASKPHDTLFFSGKPADLEHEMTNSGFCIRENDHGKNGRSRIAECRGNVSVVVGMDVLDRIQGIMLLIWVPFDPPSEAHIATASFEKITEFILNTSMMSESEKQRHRNEMFDFYLRSARTKNNGRSVAATHRLPNAEITSEGVEDTHILIFTFHPR
jgi:hypothetical protein